MWGVKVQCNIMSPSRLHPRCWEEFKKKKKSLKPWKNRHAERKKKRENRRVMSCQSIRKDHQPRVQDNWEQDMTPSGKPERKRKKKRPTVQPPAPMGKESATHAIGKITAHAEPSTLHSIGTNGVAHTIKPAITKKDTTRGNQNRLQILGISLKKFDRWTSLIVAVHWIL